MDELKNDNALLQEGMVELHYLEDGVYLTLHEKPEDAMQVVQYLAKKKIVGADFAKISECLVKEAFSKQKIAPAQPELLIPDTVEVRFSDDYMHAYMKMKKGESKEHRITIEEIKDILLHKHKIVFGLREQIIQDAIQKQRFEEEILIAKGEHPVHGKDAELIYHFDRKTPKHMGIEGADDKTKIDFKNINIYQKAEKDQVLVSKSAVIEAIDGRNVRGGKLGAKKGKDKPLPAGKNTVLSEDKRSLIATISGRIEEVDGKVCVSSAVKIDGDVDMSVGNINFDGDVEIMGNVNSGFEVNATGDITVHGLVESATLISGGDIIIEKGIHGADKGFLKANGSIFAQHIERSRIEAGTHVVTEFSLLSNIMSEGYVNVLKGRGTIMGGTIATSNYVVARTIGADSGITTNIEIGISPQKRARLKAAKENLLHIDAGMQRMELALAAANKNIDESNSKARLQISIQIGSFKKEKESLLLEIEQLEQDLAAAKYGKVHVLDKAYRGTRLCIGADVMVIKSEDQYVTYCYDHKNKRGIARLPCRYIEES